jgi:hypothetical protein
MRSALALQSEIGVNLREYLSSPLLRLSKFSDLFNPIQRIGLVAEFLTRFLKTLETIRRTAHRVFLWRLLPYAAWDCYKVALLTGNRYAVDLGGCQFGRFWSLAGYFEAGFRKFKLGAIWAQQFSVRI